MDIVSAPDLAAALGVSLPRAHRLLDGLGVPRSAGRGAARRVPHGAFDHAVRLIGAVPRRPGGFTREQVLAARALVCAVAGVSSGRELARLTSMSPTTAAAVLKALFDLGLARRVVRTVPDAGRAVVRQLWEPARLAAWPLDLLTAVAAARLPAPDDGPPGRVPRRFWHLFWNVEPSALRLPDDGAFVAARMLDGESVAATAWVLRNVPRDAIVKAVSRRGVPARTKAITRLV